MKKIIGEFIPRSGKHCITGSLKQIFEFYHYSISEDMLFGLGSGLSFVYVNQSNAPMVSGRLKPFEFEALLAERLHIQLKCKQDKNYGKVFSDTKRLIDNDRPVLIYADMPYLGYLNLLPGAHFGGHAVVLFGYDDEQQHFYVSDRDNSDFPIRTPKGTIAEDFHLVSYNEIECARTSNFRPYPANNKYLEYNFEGFMPISQSAIISAVKTTCKAMLCPPAQLLGLNGIKKFSAEILKWKNFDTEKLKRSAQGNYFMIHEDGGTGGGIFRKMYGGFLIEAAAILKSSAPEKSGEEYIQAAQTWDGIAQYMWELSETADVRLLPVMSDIITSLHKKETRILTDLSDYIDFL